MEIKPIAKIYTDFDEKFGIPRQSTLIDELKGKIIFEKEYSDISAIKGLNEFSHIWLIWEFDKAKQNKFCPTVRPPRLGGNERKGVFATRSPFRPNSLGLSYVKLEKIEIKSHKPIIYVSGIDMVNGTPIYDIKPYLSFTDSKPNAKCSFADEKKHYKLEVIADNNILQKLESSKQKALIKILENDPRPAYQADENRVYGFKFSKKEIKFKVKGNVLTLLSIENG